MKIEININKQVVKQGKDSSYTESDNELMDLSVSENALIIEREGEMLIIPMSIIKALNIIPYEATRF